MTTRDFDRLEKYSNLSFACYKCNHVTTTSNIHHSYELEISNLYEPLSSISHTTPTSPPLPKSPPNEQDDLFTPRSYSSPKGVTKADRAMSIRSSTSSTVLSPRTTSAGSNVTSTAPSKSNNFRTLIVDSNSICSKAAELSTLLNYISPDVVIMCKTKLDPSVATSEFMDQGLGYSVYRKDRIHNGGGVVVAIKDCYPSATVELTDIDSEILWTEITIKEKRKLLIATYYRPPDNPTEQIEHLDKLLKQIANRLKNNTNSIVIVGGDLNLPDID